MLRLASQRASQKPQGGVGPAQKVDLVASEIEAAQKQFRDGRHRIDRKLGAQVLVGQQILDDQSNSGS
jgi:hypothetical protein